jgi:hypothetical protein
MPIKSEIDKIRQFATISAIGKILPNEIAHTTESNYREQHIYKFLYDVRFCTIDTNLLLDELESAFDAIQPFNLKSQNYWKAAVVAYTDLWFKVAKRLLFMAQTKNHSQTISVFRFKDEAIDWLF